MKKKKDNTKRLVLLDAHAIIHRAYHALPEFATASGEPTGALYGICTMLIKIIEELKPDHIIACFDLPGPTHRHEAYDAYKGGRAKTEDNLVIQLERAKDVFKAWGIPIYSEPGFEADDILGTIVELVKGRTLKAGSQGSTLQVIIASGDMDTLQLVDDEKVLVYTLKKGINDTILYDEKAVVARFGFTPGLLPDYKGLRGDPSDNIIGVKGIGEKTATALITSFGSIEQIYKALKRSDDTYKKAGINERVRNLLIENEEEALFSKTLATIRRDAPIKFELPEDWRKCLDMNLLLELFRVLEFRTMGDKVKKLLESSDVPPKTAPSSSAEDVRSTPADALRDAFLAEHQNSREAKELRLALWVIDSNVGNPTLDEVFQFTKTDSIEEAKKVIEAELEKREVKKVFEEIEKPLIDVVEKMNECGVKIDKEMLGKLSKDYHTRLEKLEKEIWSDAGEEFNINSPKVLSQILFEKMGLGEKRQKKTPGGAISTKESELEKLKDKHEIIQKVLDYRELQKLLSTYIDAIPPQLDANSRLHSTFEQWGTTTGRMSSNNPNLQNIPIKSDLGKAIRHAFIAERGYSLVALDYSQIELRIAAILSGDEKLREIFKNGEDAHTGVAARVFKVEPENVDRGMRIKAKTINFGILYGMGVNALKVNLGTDRATAQEFYNEYFQTFTGLSAYLDRVKAEAMRNGHTETLFGRRRYFAGFKSPLPFIRAQAERMAINAPIQGTQADIIKIAMKRIDDYIKKEGEEAEMRLVLQVHDELVFEVRDDLVGKAEKKFKEIMESVIESEKREGVPIIAESKAGKNWGEMKK